MVMNHQKGNYVKQPRLKPLLDAVPPGFLVDTRWLRGRGIDPKSIHGYVERGWLERIVQGVYRRPLSGEGQAKSPAVAWEAALLSLQRILEHDVHLGGMTALHLAGHIHYLYLGGLPQVHFHGDVPAWLRRLPADTEIVVHGRGLFGGSKTGVSDSDYDYREGHRNGHAAEIWRWPLLMSGPERAALEALDDLTDEAGFGHLDKVFEGLTTLRPDMLMKLLLECRSIKVRRLFFVFAERHQHVWIKHLDKGRVGFGSGPRALVQGGWFHPEYRIGVPGDFKPGGGHGDGHSGF